MFGSFADSNSWSHPPHPCGRGQVPVPPVHQRDKKWLSEVESHKQRREPEVGQKYICRSTGLEKLKTQVPVGQYLSGLVG